MGLQRTDETPRVSVGRCGFSFENCSSVSQKWSRIIALLLSEAVNHIRVLDEPTPGGQIKLEAILEARYADRVVIFRPLDPRKPQRKLSMYIPPHFQEINTVEVKAIIETAPLGCIVAQTADGLIANHLPLLFAPDGTYLIGHVALANDMHRLVADRQEVLTIFRGDDAYISPNFYPSKPEHHRHVPTWNYQVVHVYGDITFQHDDHAKRAAVGLLTRTHERRLNGKDAWRMADAPPDYTQEMIGNIVAFRIEVRRVLAKSKLSQNREERDYRGAISGLRASGHDGLAQKMASRLPKTN